MHTFGIPPNARTLFFSTLLSLAFASTLVAQNNHTESYRGRDVVSGVVVGVIDTGSASFTLPRGTKIAKQLTEWVPASSADDGFVYVRTTNNVPLYGMELFYSRDNRVIANIPAAGIEAGITYTPPL